MKYLRLTYSKYNRKRKLKRRKYRRKILYKKRQKIDISCMHNAAIIVNGLLHNYNNNWEIENFRTYIKDNMTKVQANYAVRYFNKCNCCEKHKINRPKNLCKRIHTPKFTQKLVTCQCECRHLSRLLCDAFYH